MGELYAYGSKVTSVFQLIGMLEDDITKSIAWALCNCPVFLKKIIDEVLNIYIDPSKVRIKYQESEKDKGRTDLELTDDDLFYVIIEAKKGWILLVFSKKKSCTEFCKAQGYYVDVRV